MNKFLRIEFPNGKVYLIPTEVIAEHRTSYYSDLDGFERGSSEWDQEFEHSMKYEIEDWAMNNMDWIDVKYFAIEDPVKKDQDYSKEWCNCKHSIISN